MSHPAQPDPAAVERGVGRLTEALAVGELDGHESEALRQILDRVYRANREIRSVAADLDDDNVTLALYRSEAARALFAGRVAWSQMRWSGAMTLFSAQLQRPDRGPVPPSWIRRVSGIERPGPVLAVHRLVAGTNVADVQVDGARHDVAGRLRLRPGTGRDETAADRGRSDSALTSPRGLHIR
jgi:hypothetical protein